MWAKIIEHLQNLLVPEDAKIQKLLDFPVGMMRDLLPRSAVRMRDVFALFDYQNQMVRLIVKAIKYKNNASLRKRLAVYLHEEVLDIATEAALFEGTLPLLLPMPMSQAEKKGRGFNQCEELVKEINKLGGKDIAVSYDALRKIRETERQTKLGRQARMENIKNSMAATEQIIQSHTVIVLDDVYTTGASFAEASRALLQAGARRVIGLFIAH